MKTRLLISTHETTLSLLLSVNDSVDLFPNLGFVLILLSLNAILLVFKISTTILLNWTSKKGFLFSCFHSLPFPLILNSFTS